MTGAILAAVVPIGLAWVAVRATVPGGFLLRAGLALGVAAGLSSCGFFLWLLADGPSVGYLPVADLLVCGGAAVAFGVTRRRYFPTAYQPPLPGRLRRALPLGLAVTAGLAAVRFAVQSAYSPHGNYDAWGIWNMRARFLFRGGPDWRDAFSIENKHIDWSHPDYPLMLPGTVARGWYHLGAETQLVPILVAALFTFAAAAVLVGAVAAARGRGLACVAGSVLLGTRFFGDLGSSQYADVPLAFFVLATVALFVLHDRLAPPGGRLLALAGVCAGLAAWTKNEGLLFLVALAAGRLAVAHLHGWGRSLRELVPFAAGLLPVLAVLVVFKVGFAPPNDLVSGQGGTTTAGRLADGSRYVQIAAAVGRELRHVGPYALFALAAYAAFLRLAPRPARAGAFPLVVLGVMAAGYFGVYLTTPRPLDWHLYTSLDRLIMHLWPTALLAFALVVKSPEEALTVDEVKVPESRPRRVAA